jgi:hypothetical protein
MNRAPTRRQERAVEQERTKKNERGRGSGREAAKQDRMNGRKCKFHSNFPKHLYVRKSASLPRRREEK